MKKIGRLSVFVVVVALCTVAQATLIDHWTWDTDYANSVAGGKNITTLAGSPSITNLAKVGAGAVDLPGAGSYVWSGSSANDRNLADGTTWSMSFWIKTDAAADRGWFAGISGTTCGLWLAGDGNLIVRTYNQGNLEWDAGTGETITDWHHYAITMNGGGDDRMYVYRDGTSLGFNTQASSQFYLRAFGDVSNGYEFSGQLDDFRIYDHVLSQSEVTDLIPEPATLGLLLASSAGILLVRRRLML